MIGPVSTQNSLLTGKLTGNFSILGLNSEILAAIRHATSKACSQIPYSMEQGIVLAEQGIYWSEQGIYMRDHGPTDFNRNARRASPQTSTDFFITHASLPMSCESAQ